jgi:hypothetical protein
MIQCRSLKRISFEQSSFCLCSVWLPLADAPASMAAINLQDGTAPRISKDRVIMRPTGMKTQAMIGGIENKISPQRHKGRTPRFNRPLGQASVNGWYKQLELAMPNINPNQTVGSNFVVFVSLR